MTLTGKEAIPARPRCRCARTPASAWRGSSSSCTTVAMANQPAAVGARRPCRRLPNSRNVIPGKVVFTIDIRSPDHATLDGMNARIEAEAPRARRRARPRLRDRAGRPLRSGEVRREAASRRCATPPRASAIPRATSSPAPGTTPAGSTGSRRPR